MSRKIFAISLVLFLTASILTQATLVNADESGIPLTSPLTPPITGPAIPPVTFFDLTGNVTYEQLGKLFSGFHRFVDAANIVISVVAFFDPTKTYTTTTNSNGMYTLNIPSGLYRVSVNDGNNTLFIPPLRAENIHENKTTQANFTGILFPNL